MLLRNQIDHLADVLDESHVQHPIRLIEHEGFDLIESDVSLVDQVQQSSRSCDEYIDSFAQGTDLPCLLDSSVDHGVSKLQFSSVGGKALADLHRQFPSGAEHECTGWTAAAFGS